jgi:predicted transporter
MLIKSLILGVLFGIGVFAVKCGVGLAYLLGSRRRGFSKAAVLLLFAAAYGLLFALIARSVAVIDPLQHLAAIQGLLQSGMLVHLVMAGLMAIWGIVLLKQAPAHGAQSRGWLMLVLPCPVCAAVIWFSTAFLVSLLPDHRGWIVPGLYLAFMLISLISMAGLIFSHRRTATPATAFLGGAMLLMAAYFIVSVTVIPQFGDLAGVYRLAAYHGKPVTGETGGMLVLAGVVAAAFVAGCLWKLNHIRRTL